ncbi:cytoskeleton-associated protein 2-like isoform X2 [Agelaius phoeniceus]|uniref:cytoskeleton-associated protein 2-like isoform X2 n=1 Tax=Agelaius phoeniceus TaxID=39638 RepID=UPI004054D60A
MEPAGSAGEGASERAQRRSQLQNCQVAKERLKCSSAKPFLKDSTNRLNPSLEPVSKLKHAKEEPALDKFRKALPESRSMSQNTNNRTQPLQPSRSLPASSNLMHKNPGTKQGESTAVRQPGTTAGGSLKQHSQPPPVRRFPTKPPTLGKPQGTTNLKSNLNPGVTLPRPRPTVKEVTDRKDMKVVAPGHTAASQGTGHKNQSHSIHNSKTHVLEDELRSRGDQLKPELPKASGMHSRPVPRTPSAADRRKQLEEWLAAKGRTYKRPPMILLQKQAVIPSCRKVKPTEKQENPERHCQVEINNVLTECPKLIEPVEELRQTAFNILKDAGQKLEGEKAEEPTPREPTTPCPAERHPIASTPGLVGRCMTSLPPSVKLQVTSASRGREFLEGPELKFLTPVRRSLRTERARSRYPEMLKDHDPVVSSLSEILEILDAEEGTLFFFRKNKALPEVTELEGLSSYPPKSP